MLHRGLRACVLCCRLIYFLSCPPGFSYVVRCHLFAENTGTRCNFLIAFVRWKHSRNSLFLVSPQILEQNYVVTVLPWFENKLNCSSSHGDRKDVFVQWVNNVLGIYHNLAGHINVYRISRVLSLSLSLRRRRGSQCSRSCTAALKRSSVYAYILAYYSCTPVNR